MKKKLPVDILNADITPEDWKNDAAGPLHVWNTLRGYRDRAKFLGDKDTAQRAEAQLERLRQLVPDIDEQFKAYDESRSRNRREIK